MTKLLWIPIGLVALILLIISSLAGWVSDWAYKLAQLCDTGEQILCDFMRQFDEEDS